MGERLIHLHLLVPSAAASPTAARPHGLVALLLLQTQKRYPRVALGEDGGLEATKRVHVYGKAWALQPRDYEAVMHSSSLLAAIRGVLPRWLGGT